MGVVQQGSVELAELVNSLVAHQSLPHKQNQVRGVDVDQLGGKERRRGVRECGLAELNSHIHLSEQINTSQLNTDLHVYCAVYSN